MLYEADVAYDADIDADAHDELTCSTTLIANDAVVANDEDIDELAQEADTVSVCGAHDALVAYEAVTT